MAVMPCLVSAEIVNGLFSNAAYALMKRISSLKDTTRTAIVGRPMMKFESGYTVETVFDGSKLGIEPYSVEVLPSGDLLILDSANSNLYKISSSLSVYSRPNLIAGSPEGYSGHIDGKSREARMNHPKGLTVDNKGNIYIADTDNMSIRKISDSGVTTIAGGKWGKGGGHVDGASEEAKFSKDFDVVYVGSSCSLLVIDRGNRAIREIQLHFDDCAYHYESGFLLGFSVLLGAGFFGYMLALLQHRVSTIVYSQNDQEMMKTNFLVDPPYQKPPKSNRQPLIPSEEEMEKQEESFFGSLINLFMSTGAAGLEILGTIFPVLRKKPQVIQYQQKQFSNSSSWPMQESFVIPDGDEPPPSIETRDPTTRKIYAFMSNDAEKIQQLRQSRVFYNGWDQDGNFTQHQRQSNYQHQHQHQHQHHRHRRHHSSIPHTYYEKSLEKANEVVFGAVQEIAGEKVDIKPLDYSNPIYYHQNIRPPMSYTS
ncbi:hypothetical protein SAY86_002391 [Trapa natans]|uniref:Teneurin NHL domain-containing protein n=1 Tax=Trapa natans TaxID=22666 RepID=A0AAN7R0I0_TRANT|nr:hypothetical protein SAY86_002391 [Trapa natans]